MQNSKTRFGLLSSLPRTSTCSRVLGSSTCKPASKRPCAFTRPLRLDFPASRLLKAVSLMDNSSPVVYASPPYNLSKSLLTCNRLSSMSLNSLQTSTLTIGRVQTSSFLNGGTSLSMSQIRGGHASLFLAVHATA
jgi:hypothetical protein